MTRKNHRRDRHNPMGLCLSLGCHRVSVKMRDSRVSGWSRSAVRFDAKSDNS